MISDSQQLLNVVTVNYNSWDECRSLVESLDGHGVVTRMVIVDHSERRVRPRLEAEFPIEVITRDNRGYGAGLNAGISEIGQAGGMALVCNPDIRLVTPETVIPAVAYMKAHPDVAILVPSCVDSQNRPIRSCRTFYTLGTLLAS